MINPMIQYNFCPQCGQPLRQDEIFGRPRPHFPPCAYVHWGNFSLGVGGIVWREEKVLLVQRAHNPGKGVWTIPGGYVDQAERIADAAAREILEETGIIAEPVSVLGLRDRPGDNGDKHDAYIVFLLEYRGGTLQADPHEVGDLGFFTMEECRQLPVSQLSLSVIEASRPNRNKGFAPQTGLSMLGKQSVLYHIPKL